MIVELINFRCHIFKTYTLPDTGLTLIDGTSGSGKTTLLNAMFFCWYGKFPSPYTFGEKKCKVVITDNKRKIKIERSQLPKKLIVEYNDSEYEDNAAQGIIEKVYNMNYNQFQTASYSDQKQHSSILSLNSEEQFHFIEALSFDGDKHITTKKTINANTKALAIEKIANEAQKNLSFEHVERCSKTTDELKQKLDGVGFTNISLENLKIDHKSKIDTINQLKIEIIDMRTIYDQTLNEEYKYKNYVKELDRINTNINNTKVFISGLEKPTEQKELKLKQRYLVEDEQQAKTLKFYNEYLVLEQECSVCEQKYLNEKNEKLENLKRDILPLDEFENLKDKIEKTIKAQEEYSESIRIYNDTLKNKNDAIRNIKIARNSLKSFEDDIPNKPTAMSNYISTEITKRNNQFEKLKYDRFLTNSDNLSCPSCKTNLKLDDKGILVTHDINMGGYSIKDINDEIEKINRHVKALTDAKETCDRYCTFAITKLPVKPKATSITTSCVQELLLQVEEQKSMRIEYVKLKDEKIPFFLIDLKDKMNEKKKILDGMSNINKDLDLDILEQKIKNDATNISHIISVNNEHEKLNQKLRDSQKEIGRLGKQPDHPKFSSADLDKKINKLQDEYEELDKQISSIKEAIYKYETFTTFNEELKLFEQTFKEKEEKCKELEYRTIGSLKLEELSRKAAFESVKFTIQVINEYAKGYLKQMFDDNISVNLIVTDDTAQPSIKVDIKYKGENYNKISDLSGGERQRCDLAFLLAVNQVMSVDILFLDECLNNLNSETNMTTLQMLKESCNLKQIFVISHEAVKGIFDQTVSIG